MKSIVKKVLPFPFRIKEKDIYFIHTAKHTLTHHNFSSHIHIPLNLRYLFDEQKKKIFIY